MKHIRITKWWWAWNYEQMEAWLEEMEMSGLRLEKIGLMGIVFYFTQGEPKRARYCIDYQNKLAPDYLSLLNDDGWRLFQMGAGWYVCRKEYENERPNLFSDFDSAIQRNQRLLGLLLICVAPLFGSWTIMINRFTQSELGFSGGLITVTYCLLMIFYIFCSGKLLSTIKILKKKQEISKR